MAWTKEQKRDARKKRKAMFLNEQDKIGAQMIKKAPPLKLLKAPYKQKDLGIALVGS